MKDKHGEQYPDEPYVGAQYDGGGRSPAVLSLVRKLKAYIPYIPMYDHRDKDTVLALPMKQSGDSRHMWFYSPRNGEFLAMQDEQTGNVSRFTLYPGRFMSMEMASLVAEYSQLTNGDLLRVPKDNRTYQSARSNIDNVS